MQSFIKSEIDKLSSVLEMIKRDEALLQLVEDVSLICTQALQQRKKILLFGNGGSAADAQHLSAELVSRLRYNRPGLAAIALTTDTSALTAIGNDYAFENIFSRQVESLGQPGDVAIGISTSGKSPNILRAFEVARERNMITIGLTGSFTGAFQVCCDWILSVPSQETPKIQECHIMLGHIVCALIEDRIFGAEFDPARKVEEKVA